MRKMSYKKLTRPRTGRMLGGVCCGVARYFDIDPTIVRLGFVALWLFTALFPGLIAYALSCIIIPTADD